MKKAAVILGLPGDTIIEVVRVKGDEVVKKEMTYSEWMNLTRQPGYRYSAFQKGYSAYKL